ncbi:MAG: ATP-binding protein [Bryobacteraceae bacterium]
MKTLLAWSSGKDSAWTLDALRRQGIEVGALLTTLNEAADRVAMHGVRRTLVEAQAEAVGVPLWKVPLPWPCTNDDYEARMADACRRAVVEGFDSIAFGDLFLRDVRAYRERQLAGSGLAPLFPLWEIPTASLARDMIGAGLRARLTCVDSKALDGAFAGREFNRALLAELPERVDPCGENGEFHTFVCDGPMFRAPVEVEAGEIRAVDQFVYADLLPRAGLS